LRDAILYRARKVTRVVQREIDRLAYDLPDLSIFVVCYDPAYQSVLHSTPGRVYCYGQRDLHKLPYPQKLGDVDWADPTSQPASEPVDMRFFRRMERGHQDLPVMKFFLDHPDFDRYWVIEDDVRCSGPWSDTFTDLERSRADLLMAAVQHYSEVPNWQWWTHLVTGDDASVLDQRVKGFLPFCRLSAACLEAIDRKYRQGWGGHYEVTWPTVALASGLTIEDIGGEGSYTPAERRGRHYVCTLGSWHLFPGTFVYRPPFHDMGDSKFGKEVTSYTMLWHPVKVQDPEG
jgi:hypothetical protein